jgi:hypothetical protein
MFYSCIGTCLNTHKQIANGPQRRKKETGREIQQNSCHELGQQIVNMTKSLYKLSQASDLLMK